LANTTFFFTFSSAPTVSLTVWRKLKVSLEHVSTRSPLATRTPRSGGLRRLFHARIIQQPRVAPFLPFRFIACYRARVNIRWFLPRLERPLVCIGCQNNPRIGIFFLDTACHAKQPARVKAHKNRKPRRLVYARARRKSFRQNQRCFIVGFGHYRVIQILSQRSLEIPLPAFYPALFLLYAL
jgi:hypothetical protein